jgi:site-specific DNA recombinase
MLRNERYRGVVHWNTSEWRKDPDSGKRKRVTRPRSEWISYVDESLRVVSDDVWERAQRRMRPAKDDVRLKAGGKPKYLLSGLLRCDVCDAHYTITDAVSYGCSSYHDGHACSNSIRVRRDRVESILLGPIRDDLASPERIARMAAEMQELASRIERLRERMKRGDPDMTADELQAAIEKTEEKRRELEEQQAGAASSARAPSILPRAAELYRRQVALGLEGDPQATLKARVFLRDWFGGKIRLEPLPDGGLMAHWNQNVGALCKGLGSCGSGGRI